MALIFMDGCDHFIKWTDNRNFFGTQSWSSNIGKFGGGAVWGSDSQWSRITVPSAAGGIRLLAGFWLNYAGSTGLFRIMNELLTEEARIVNNGGALGFCKWGGGSTVFVTGTKVLQSTGWHWIDLDINYHASTGWVKCYIDGVLELNQTGLNMITSGTPSIKTFYFNSVNGSAVAYLDDLVWYDDNAGDLTSADFPLGPMRIETLVANGDVQQDFSRSSGSTNYTLINETTISTANYVESSTSNALDLYDYTNMTTTPQTIKLVATSQYWVNNGGSSIQAKAVCKSNTTFDESAAQTLPFTYALYQKTHKLDPNTSAAWTKTGVDAAKFGVRVV